MLKSPIVGQTKIYFNVSAPCFSIYHLRLITIDDANPSNDPSAHRPTLSHTGTGYVSCRMMLLLGATGTCLRQTT